MAKMNVPHTKCETGQTFFSDRVGNIFLYTTWKLGSSLSCKHTYTHIYIYIYIYIYVIYICVWDRGEGDTVASQSLLAISCIKAHGTQYLEENARKCDRNDDTRLYCSSTSRGSVARVKRCQYESTSACSSCFAYAPLLRCSRATHACGVKGT